MLKKRLQRALEAPFPEDWRHILSAELHWYAALDGRERQRLEEHVRVMLADKSFEGTVGFTPTHEMCLLIAAQASLLILELDYEMFGDVSAVIVSDAVIKHDGARNIDGGVLTDGTMRLAGQARLHGPVLISWHELRLQMTHPERGRNVVLHEFAHKLDMRDGAVDGTPPLSSALAGVWRPTMDSMLERIRSEDVGPLDAYGATNAAELMAVATEAFFLRPLELFESAPAVYTLLQAFYGQDTARRPEITRE